MADISQLAGALLGKVYAVYFSGHKPLIWAANLSLVLVILLAEVRQGRDLRRYLARGVRTDVLYNVLYVSGVFTVLFWLPVSRLLEGFVATYAPFLRLGLLARLPVGAHHVLYFLLTDLLAYFFHRLLHSNRFLWALHSIHHSQETLTFLTGRRFHVLDSVLENALALAPALLLGVPPAEALPIVLVRQWYSALQHSDLDWSFGRLDLLLVSPRFHSVHHSTDAAHYNKHFGTLLSVWDHVFGTAEREPHRPPAYGLADLRIPESFVRQLYFPIRQIAVELGSGRAPVPRPTVSGT